MIEFKSFASSSKGNLYTVDDGETKLLIECGIPWAKIQRALDFKTSEVAGVLLSHADLDHSCGLKEVLRHGLDVWSSEEALNGHESHRSHIVTPLIPFRIGTWEITGLDGAHDDEGCLAWLMENRLGERFLFATDMAYIQYQCPGLQVLAIEANFDEDLLRANVANGTIDQAHKKRVYESHLSLQRVVAFLKANDLSRLREVHLVHLSNLNSDAAKFRRIIQSLVGVPVYIAAA
uniref:Putative beta-lactamase superfamily domain n=1 Tax=viral metagenome TaxID=1070528 RepID=A0A6M3LX00_9ZZZZ